MAAPSTKTARYWSAVGAEDPGVSVERNVPNPAICRKFIESTPKRIYRPNNSFQSASGKLIRTKFQRDFTAFLAVSPRFRQRNPFLNAQIHSIQARPPVH
jgi:hypothetical protein